MGAVLRVHDPDFTATTLGVGAEWSSDKVLVKLNKATYYSFSLGHGYCFLTTGQAQQLRDSLNLLLDNDVDDLV